MEFDTANSYQLKAKSSLWIVIANYNGLKYLPECLGALRNQTKKPDGIIVVDDASTDESLLIVKENFPEIINAPLPKNVGFGAANNHGARVAISYGATALIFLNNDTVPNPDWLKKLWSAFEKNPQAGAIGSTLLLYDNPEIIQSAGIEILKNGGAKDYLAGQALNNLPSDIAKIFAPSAAAMLIPVSVWKKISGPTKKNTVGSGLAHQSFSEGGFDENYKMYLEDVDLGYKIHQAGYHCLLAPESRALHHYSGSMVSHPFRKRWFVEKNRYRLLAKHFTFFQALKAQTNYFLTMWRRTQELKTPQGQKMLLGKSKLWFIIKITVIFFLAHITGKLLYLKLKLLN